MCRQRRWKRMSSATCHSRPSSKQGPGLAAPRARPPRVQTSFAHSFFLPTVGQGPAWNLLHTLVQRLKRTPGKAPWRHPQPCRCPQRPLAPWTLPWPSLLPAHLVSTGEGQCREGPPPAGGSRSGPGPAPSAQGPEVCAWASSQGSSPPSLPLEP